ncbi:hypothetical protein PTI45_03958 [Paenibacillus nuruki]|uniref:Uncharacterized protein n=1 Tax=Paenibacillus nuruki TaxID=1886670 RepID=A0A1E3KYR8_9BACL|nr:hypothetical protein [Paenibacillus nuruki]ODP26679.1 hypothetical protein PTI45_03958 [Paenibacillus nuruki]
MAFPLVTDVMKTVIKARRRMYSQKEMSYYFDMTFREYQLFEQLKLPVSRGMLELITERIKVDIPENYIDEIMKYYANIEEKKIGKVIYEDRKTTYINPKFTVSIKIDRKDFELDPERITSINISYSKNRATIQQLGSSTVIEQCGTYYLEMIQKWANANGIKLSV